jgi:hypothetical protein
MTMSAWIYPTYDANSPTIISQYQNTVNHKLIKLLRIDAGILTYFTSDSTGGYQQFGTMAVSINTWHFVSVTVSGSIASPTVTLTLDGVSETSALAALSATPDTSVKVEIGDNQSGGGEMFSGKIDELRIYNRALSADEIKRLYLMGASLKTNVTHRDQLTEGLVGNWTFDGKDMDIGSSTKEVYDVSGQGNHGNWQNHATTTAIGKIGQGLQFDGVDDYVSTVSSNVFPTGALPRTVSAWIKGITPSADLRQIVGYGVDAPGEQFVLSMGYPNTSKLFFWGNTINLQGNAIIDPDRWTMVTATYDGTTVFLYVNGVLDASANLSLNTGSSGFFIGIYNQFDYQYANGSIDETRIYNRALSADEVKRLYLMGK